MRGIRLPRWMYPGMHIKRWLVLAFVGITILGLGAAIFVVDLYRRFGADNIPIVFWLTGAPIERPIRAVIVGVIGLVLTGFGVWGLMRSVVSPFVARGDSVLEGERGWNDFSEVIEDRRCPNRVASPPGRRAKS